ncbi:MAG: Ig-like domain-containing protein [Xanthomonadales bacterium]|nr:Ig-like domain-containing protein [Xanthomonadales bacterium]
MRALILFIAVVSSLVAAPFACSSEIDDSVMALRHRLSESGSHILMAAPASQRPATTANLIEALSIPNAQFLDVSLEAPPLSVAVLPELGAIRPTQGSHFVVLSTGVAGSTQPVPGQDYRSADGRGNGATLTLVLDPPPGTAQLSLDYLFLTAEYPAFVGSLYEDRFTATLTDAEGRKAVFDLNAGSPLVHPVTPKPYQGSGFDLFTPDPLALDAEFGLGLPAAGTTGWRTLTLPFMAQGPIMVELEIRDAGDGLFDSTVLLSNLQITSMMLLGEGDDHFWRSCAHAYSSTGPFPMRQPVPPGPGAFGVVADGKTKWPYAILNTTRFDYVQYALIGGSAPEDGGLGGPGTNDRLDLVLLPITEQLVPGFWGAYAHFFAPEEFNRGGDEDDAERQFAIQTCFRNVGGPLQHCTTRPFRILRPPVVLMHGLWSRAQVWRDSPIHRDERTRTFPVNYAATHARGFAVNSKTPEGKMMESCFQLHEENVLSSRVDFVGHSMGGNLGRLYNSHASNRINKLITINTPHHGSPFANVTAGVRDSLPIEARLAMNMVMRLIKRAIDEGAIDDLVENSAGITSIPATLIPGHALVGTGGSAYVGEQLRHAPTVDALTYAVLHFFVEGALNLLFDGEEHDLIVARGSQTGGLSPLASTLYSGADSMHTLAPSSTNYAAGVMELLNSHRLGSMFEYFPEPTILTSSLLDKWSAVAPTLSERLARIEVIPSGIEVLVPGDGSPATAGEPVQFTVVAADGFGLNKVLVIGSDSHALIEQPPFEQNVWIPLEHAGAMAFAVLGKDASGNITGPVEVSVQVTVSASLLGVDILNSTGYLFGIGDNLQLSVQGLYDDDIDRDLTHPSTGTVYFSSNPSIATVDENGRVTSVDHGTTAIIAQNGNFQDGILVTVMHDDRLFANGFETFQWRAAAAIMGR